MKKRNDSMYERGFNVAYYLNEYAPHILERAMKGLKGEPKDFFEGLRVGKAQSAKEKGVDTKKKKKEDDREYWRDYRNEKEKEARYQEKLKEDAKKKKEDAEIEGRLLEREMRTDHVQKRLEELNKIRKREQETREKYPKVEVKEKENEPENEILLEGAAEKVEAPTERETHDMKDEEIVEHETEQERRLDEIEETRNNTETMEREQDSQDKEILL